VTPDTLLKRAAEVQKPEAQSGTVLKQGAIYALGNILSRLGGFLLLPLYLRALTPTEYGVLEMFYTSLTVLSLFVSGGLSQAALRYYYEYDATDERKSVISTALAAAILFSAVGTLLLWPLATQASQLLVSSTAYAGSFKLVMLTLIAQMANEVGLSYFRVKGYHWRFVFASTSLLVLQVAINLYTVVVLRMGVPGVLLGNMLGAAFGACIVAGVTFRECGLRFRGTQLAHMLRYTWPMVVAGIAGVVMDRADRFILAEWLGLGAVGIYGLAEKITMIFAIGFLQPFKLAYGVHRFAIIKSPDRAFQQSETFRKYCVSAGMIGLMIVVFGQPGLRFIAEPGYWAAIALLPMLMVRSIVSGAEYIFHTGILYAGRTGYSMAIHIANGAVRILFALAFINYLGIAAPAYAAALGMCFAAVASMIISRRFDTVDWNLPVALRISLICLGCYAINQLMGGGWLSALVATVAYIPGCLVFNVVSSADILRTVEVVRQQINDVLGRSAARSPK